MRLVSGTFLLELRFRYKKSRPLLIFCYTNWRRDRSYVFVDVQTRYDSSPRRRYGSDGQVPKRVTGGGGGVGVVGGPVCLDQLFFQSYLFPRRVFTRFRTLNLTTTVSESVGLRFYELDRPRTL